MKSLSLRILFVIVFLSLTWVSSNAQAVTYNMAETSYNWVDITATGTKASLSGDDSFATLPIGFNFSYFGNSYSSVYASTNGLAGFSSSGITAFANQYIPSAGTPNNMVAAFWDDLYVNTSTGGVYYKTIGSAPNRVFVVEWANLRLLGGSNYNLTFEALYYEGTNNIVLQYYNGITDNSSSTVGIENTDGTGGNQYEYNTSKIHTGLAILFSPSTLPPPPPPPAPPAGAGGVVATFNLAANQFALDQNSNLIYASLPGQNSVAIIDANTLRLVNTVFVGSAPRGLALSPDGGILYVALTGATQIAVLNTATLQLLPGITLPQKPSDIAVGLGGRLYITPTNNGLYSDIMQVDSNTGQYISSFSSGVFVYYDGFLQISPDRRTLYFANQGLSPGTIAKYDVSTATPLLLYMNPHGSLGSNGEELCLSHNGSSVYYVVGSGNSSYDIATIQTSDMSIAGSLQTGPYPEKICIGPDDKVAYVVHDSSHIDIFDTATYLTTAQIPTTTKAKKLITDASGLFLFAAFDTGLVVYRTYVSPPAVIPPSSTITAPAPNAALRGLSYTVTGTATSGNAAGLRKVEVGITPSGGSTTWYQAAGTTSWSYAWTLPVDGNYTIQSRATDNVGNIEGLASVRSVKVDNTVPSSAVTAPSANSLLTGTTTTIFGTASDAGSGLQKVEVGITPIGGTTAWYQAAGTTSWSYTWTLPADGNYTIQSRATDNAGNVEIPVAGRAVKVDNTPPASTITAPSVNTILAGTTTTITGTASDAGSGVQKVQVGITNSAGSTTWYLASGTTTWSYSWNSSVEGCYTIVSRATDNTNKAEQQGAGRTVIVDRNPPASTINPPKWEFIGPYLPDAANKIVYDMVIAPAVPKTIYVGGYSGIYRSTDDGLSWTKSSSPSQTGIGDITVSPIDPNIVFAGTWYNIYKSIDGGGTFNIFNNFNSPGLRSPDVGAIAIDPKTPDTIYTGIYSSVYKSTDAGTTWNKMFDSVVYDSFGSTSYMISDIVIDPVNSSVVYAVDCCHLNKSVDGGNTWFAVNSGMNTNGSLNALAIDPSNSSVLYSGAEGVGVYKSVNGGVSWNLVWPTTLRIHAIKVDARDPNTIYAGAEVLTGLSGGVYKSVDGGFSWGLVGIPERSVYHLAIDESGKLYAGTDNWVYRMNSATKLINGSAYLLSGSILEKGSGVDFPEISIMPKGGSPSWSGAGINDTSGNGSWSTWNYNWVLPADGVYTVQFRAADKAGYVESPGDSAEFIIDNTPPAGSVLIVEGPYVSSHTVNLALVATDANCVPQMQISGDGIFDNEPWEALAASRAWTLSAGDGEKTIYVRYKDSAGNISQYSARTTIDTSAPVTSINAPSDKGYVSGDTYLIKGTSVDNGGSGVKKVEVSTDGGTSWNTASGTVDWSYNWQVPSVNSACQIMARAVDNLGNAEVSGPGISVNVLHDLAVISIDKAFCSGPLDKAIITVTDIDSDSTAGPGNDKVVVKAVSSSDILGEVVTLDEDPLVPGRFTGKIGFEPYRSFDGDGKVYVSRGDTVSISYTDKITPAGCPQDVTAATSWTSGRAMWLKNADNMVDGLGTARADFFAFCTSPFGVASDRVDTVYMDALSAMVNKASSLRSFIAAAHSHNIRVECLVGTPDWATPGGIAVANAALDTLAGFNDSSYMNERFDGVHIGVEIDQVDSGEKPKSSPWPDFIAMLRSCRGKIDSFNLAGYNMTLAADIPSGINLVQRDDAYTDAVQDIADYSVVKVMSDKSKVIRLTAQREVNNAALSGKKVLVGVETNCDRYKPENSFCQEGNLAMDAQLMSAVSDWNAIKSYMGEAIDDYDGYRSLNLLLDRPASKNPRR